MSTALYFTVFYSRPQTDSSDIKIQFRACYPPESGGLPPPALSLGWSVGPSGCAARAHRNHLRSSQAMVAPAPRASHESALPSVVALVGASVLVC
jgi:hypothetical protein